YSSVLRADDTPLIHPVLLPPPCPTLFPYTTLFRSQQPVLSQTDAQHKARNRASHNAGTCQAEQQQHNREDKSKTSAALWLARLRSEEHTSELQSRSDLVCRLLLEKKKKQYLRNVKQ